MDKAGKKSVRLSAAIAAVVAVAIAAAALYDRVALLALLGGVVALCFYSPILIPAGIVMDKAGNKSLPASFASAAVIATVLYVVDALVLIPLGLFFITQGVLFGVVLLYFLPASLLALRRDRRVAKLRAAKASIYFVAAVVVVATNGLQDRMTNRRAVKIGDACMAYRAKYHHYPKKLDALVPEFISSVPVAKYGLRGNDDFEYSGVSDDFEDPMLCLPDVRFTCYLIESHMWTSHWGFN